MGQCCSCCSSAEGEEDPDSPGCCLCGGCCWGRSKRVKRDEERKKQENSERRRASEVAVQFCKRDDIRAKYSLEDDGRSRNIGGRLQKYWFVLHELPSQLPEEVDSGVSSAPESTQSSDDITPVPALKSQHALLSISPLPSGCPLEMDDKTITKLNKILKIVQQHPFIHPVKKLEYLEEEKKVALIQTFHTAKGSLRDVIFGETPYRPKKKLIKESLVPSWSKKYGKMPQPFSTDQIALFGRQILEAMVFLHEVGFKALGHVHTGNIFIAITSDDQEVCQLGGYEQTLLGYRTMLYREIHRMKLLKYIDIIMFGHVIYEMSTGRALTGVCLTREEHRSVGDKSIKKVLKDIFMLKTSLKKLLGHEFFRAQAQVVDREVNKVGRERLTKKKKKILQKVAQLYEAEGSENLSVFQKLFSRRSSTSTGIHEPLLSVEEESGR